MNGFLYLLSYLDDEVQETMSLFWAGYYNNNLLDLKKYLDHFCAL